MTAQTPDLLVLDDNWSDLTQFRAKPEIDFERLHQYRIGRIRQELKRAGAAMCMLINPISLRYAVDYACYGQFQAHIPTTYLFVAADGPTVLFNAYDPTCRADQLRQGQHTSFFDGGTELEPAAQKLAADVVDFLNEIGTDNRRVALEYVNPSIVHALASRGLEVTDGVAVSGLARTIKSADEIECIRWSIAVAEHGVAKLKEAIAPGVTELQLWGLLNYNNLANHGTWHDGRMLASGARINPWLQEASSKRVESGDLVGFDTDMIGPNGYFADISRTFHCGPGKPTPRQKELYRLAYDEVQHNIELLKPGLTFSDFQRMAFKQDPVYHENAYVCVVHAVGMCDEYPRINPAFRGPVSYDGTFEAGMVICVESYVGAPGETDGVKLEEQVLITETGPEVMTTYPFEDALLN